MKRAWAAVALAVGLFGASVAGAVTIDLAEWAVKVDGTVYNVTSGDTLPGNVNAAGFDGATGLGTLQVTLGGAGSHFVALFVDHEIDESTNTFFNEFGAAVGSPAAGQSWEIDEPGYAFGDIYTNFEAGALDNTNGVPAGSEDDVSMALGWAFVLNSGESATLRFLLGTTAPAGFYLRQVDPDSAAAAPASLYFSSDLRIGGGGGGGVIPEPGTMVLLGSGLLGLAGWRRRRAG